jgi:hypothetical protein
MPQVTFSLNKAKVALIFFGAATFVAGGYSMFRAPAETASQSFLKSPELVHFAGLACVVFFGLCMIAALIKLLDASPALILDDQGLTNNSGILGSSFVPWSEITGFQVHQIKRQRILYVLLRDPSSYLSTLTPFKRRLLKATLSIGPSPIAISSNLLSVRTDDLMEDLNARLSAFRREA